MTHGNFSISDEWTRFAGNVIPLDASDIQRTEMRRAFYAGAIALIDITSAIAEIPDENTGVRILERLHVEKHAFLNEINRLAKEQK
jgi:hypothetical protein